jgi:HAD superfamily hydrolase (TIGR01509 family)
MIFGPDTASVVFDMDGVLWHSSAIHAAAYQAVLNEAGLSMPDYARIAGRRTDEVMRELLEAQHPAGADQATVAALTDAKQRMARQLLREKPSIVPGCVEVLERLGRSCSLALASSASAATVDLFLDVSGTRALFQAVVSGDDVAAAKPDPAIYLTALQRLRCPPAGAAVVEDAPNGIMAAVAAAAAVVVAVEGTAPRAALLQAGAHRVVGNLKDLVL